MFSSFKAISLSHKNASVAIRERIALDEVAVRKLLTTIACQPGIADVMILSTCNRTEIYYCAEEDQSHSILQILMEQKQLLEQIDYFRDLFRVITSPDEAVAHLFRVAAGLESKEIGDSQIYPQVKRAYEWSVQENTAGSFLHRLMHTIFFTHKRIIQESAFQQGITSLSRAAVELAELISTKVTQPAILVIGLGEIGTEVCKYLSDSPLSRVSITNRTFAKVESIMATYNFDGVPFEDLSQAIEKADIVISSVCRAQPLITPDSLSRKGASHHQYFIDLSVPRSVSPALEEFPGVVIYNIDELQQQTDTALENRLSAVPQVEQILMEEIAQLKTWAGEQILSPLIGQLKGVLEAIRQEEMSRYRGRISSREMEILDKSTKDLMQKFIKLPVLQLKAACKRGETEMMVEAVNELFKLNTPFQSKVRNVES